MKSSTDCKACNAVGLLLARVPLGIVLAMAGYTKIFQTGVGEFVDHSRTMAERYMSSGLANMYLHAVPYAELTVGALLVVGFLTRLNALVAALMLASFGIATGGLSGFINTHPENAARLFQAPFTYGMLALVALFAGPGKISVDGLLFRDGRDGRCATLEK